MSRVQRTKIMQGQKSYSRPDDRSLNAFKTWALDIAKHLGAEDDDLTEQEWLENWQTFWKNIEAKRDD